MHRPTDDVRVESLRPLLPPAILLEEVAIAADGQQFVADARAQLSPRVLADCSHDNSGKDHTRQPAVAADIARQISTGSDSILGVMIESFLVEGRQKLDAQQPLVYGQSITDTCIGWETTERLLEVLAKAIASRRSTACTNASAGLS